MDQYFLLSGHWRLERGWSSNTEVGVDVIQSKSQLEEIVQPSTTAIRQHQTPYTFGYQYNPSGAGSIRPHAPTHIGDRTFTYDANGNQTG